jgi:hypothetical protein
MTRSISHLVAAAVTAFALGAATPVQAQELMAANAGAAMVLFPVAPMPLVPAIAAPVAAAPAAQDRAFDRSSFTGPVRRPSLLPALYASQIALQVLDAHSTSKALGRGAHEANPLMKGVVGNRGAMMAVKAGVAAGTIFLAERMWKRGNRVGAIATMLVVNGVTGAVVANNYRVASSLR